MSMNLLSKNDFTTRLVDIIVTIPESTTNRNLSTLYRFWLLWAMVHSFLGCSNRGKRNKCRSHTGKTIQFFFASLVKNEPLCQHFYADVSKFSKSEDGSTTQKTQRPKSSKFSWEVPWTSQVGGSCSKWKIISSKGV
jgi:hypothetical protein